MSKKKQTPQYSEPAESDQERREKEDAIIEKLHEEESLMFCLNLFSGQFKNWSAILDEVMSEAIAEKQKRNIPCEREQKALDRIKSMLALLSDSSSLISDLQTVVSQKLEMSNLLLKRKPDTEMEMMSHLLSKLSYFGGYLQDAVETGEFVENIGKAMKRRKE
jgi:hypothetical protein